MARPRWAGRGRDGGNRGRIGGGAQAIAKDISAVSSSARLAIEQADQAVDLGRCGQPLLGGEAGGFEPVGKAFDEAWRPAPGARSSQSLSTIPRCHFETRLPRPVDGPRSLQDRKDLRVVRGIAWEALSRSISAHSDSQQTTELSRDLLNFSKLKSICKLLKQLYLPIGIKPNWLFAK